MSDRDAEQVTQDEVREEAASHHDDPVTKREALETELMEEDSSPSGEEIGEPTP